MVGSHHVRTDKIRKIHKFFMLVKLGKSWECRAYAVEFCFVLYLDDANWDVLVFYCF